MKRIKYDKGNRVIVCPYNWIALNYETPLECAHVGVVTLQHRIPTIPQFLFFASKPIEDFSREEMEYMYALCEAECKEFGVVRKEQISKVGMFEILEYLTYSKDEVAMLHTDV